MRGSGGPDFGRRGRAGLVGVAIVVATLVLCTPLLRSGSALPVGHDTAFAVQSATTVAEALESRVVCPRWADTPNFGLGAPVFVFYPPLAFLAAGGLARAADGDAVAGLRWMAMLAALLSGVTFAAAFLGQASAGGVALGAALYVLAPYHVLDLYWRFAFAEHVAFLWIPLIFLFARRVLEGRAGEGVAPLAFSYAGLVLTHVVTAFLAPLVLGAYALVHLLSSGRWRRGAILGGAGLLGVALAGVYVVPMLAQQERVRLEWLRQAPYADYRDAFLLRSPGDLRLDPERPTRSRLNRAAAAQGLLGLVGAVLLVSPLRARSRPWAGRRGEGAGWSGSGPGVEGRALAAAAAWALFLQLPLSASFWRLVPGLPTVQFPWRFQSFLGFCACGLVVLAVSRGARGRIGMGLHAAAVALAAGVALWVASQGISPGGISFGPREASHPAVLERPLFEYLPRSAPPGGALPRNLPRARLEGEGRVRVERWGPHRRTLRVAAPEADRIVVRTFAYPGWRARLDGAPVPIRAARPAGEIAVDVPAGEHTLRLTFERTWDRWAGLGTSAAALLVTGVLWRSRRRERAR